MSTPGGEWVLRLADGPTPPAMVAPGGGQGTAAQPGVDGGGPFAVNWRYAARCAHRDRAWEAVSGAPRTRQAPGCGEFAPKRCAPWCSRQPVLFELVNAQAESQRRFVADAAHQLRTPLAAQQAQVEAWGPRPHHADPAERPS